MLNTKKLLTRMLKAIGFWESTSITTEYGTAYVQRTFNVVTVMFEGLSKPLTHGSYVQLFSLGANVRPMRTIRFLAFDNTTGNVSNLSLVGYINDAGDCYVWVYSGNGTNVAPRFSVTYVRTGSLT